MRLIDNANQFYKMWSVWVVSLIFVLEIANQNWAQYSEVVPQPYHGYIQSVLAVATVIARVIRQQRLYDATK